MIRRVAVVGVIAEDVGGVDLGGGGDEDVVDFGAGGSASEAVEGAGVFGIRVEDAVGVDHLEGGL